MKMEEIKTGDYLYYTERPYSNYADALVEIRNVNGVDMAHPLCANWQGKYENEPSGGWEGGDDLPIAAYFDEKCWSRTSYTGGDPAEWMARNYPLDKPKRVEMENPAHTVNMPTDTRLKSEPQVRCDAGLAARWTQEQKDKAWGIVNDIAEDIDNHETRAELRQALAIYADMLYDALQKRACEKTGKMMEAVNKFAELMAANEKGQR